jgi:hypothetical protein
VLGCCDFEWQMGPRLLEDKNATKKDYELGENE